MQLGGTTAPANREKRSSPNRNLEYMATDGAVNNEWELADNQKFPIISALSKVFFDTNASMAAVSDPQPDSPWPSASE
jgi:hypothetical protein